MRFAAFGTPCLPPSTHWCVCVWLVYPFESKQETAMPLSSPPQCPVKRVFAHLVCLLLPIYLFFVLHLALAFPEISLRRAELPPTHCCRHFVIAALSFKWHIYRISPACSPLLCPLSQPSIECSLLAVAQCAWCAFPQSARQDFNGQEDRRTDRQAAKSSKQLKEQLARESCQIQDTKNLATATKSCQDLPKRPTMWQEFGFPGSIGEVSTNN